MITIKNKEYRLPDAIIIGCQKSGTTALKYYLAQHPDIYATNDELHYFDQREHKGIEWYLSHFTGRTEKITMCKTPAYIFFPEIPAKIKEMRQDIKLIVLLREPVSRAYSEYMMQHLKGVMPYSFEHLVFDEDGKVDTNRVCIKRGMYAKQLENLYQYFDKSQVLVLKAEDLKTDRQNIINIVCDFLEIDRFVPADQSDRHVGGQPKYKIIERLTGIFTIIQGINKKRFEWIQWIATKCIRILKHFNRTRGYEPMKDSTREKLERFFEPHNAELEVLERIRW